MSSFATNHRQLSLLPLHPENSTSEYKDNPNDNNMAYFFSSVDGGATTLTNLLRSSTTSSSDNDNNTTNNNLNNCTTLSSSVSLSYGHCEEGAVLVRTALRNKERDTNEEIKWVCYSEVVERRPDEEVTSCVDAADAADDQRKFQSLSLKLDYQDILNAWSDRGPLYIHAESSQIVPVGLASSLQRLSRLICNEMLLSLQRKFGWQKNREHKTAHTPISMCMLNCALYLLSTNTSP